MSCYTSHICQDKHETQPASAPKNHFHTSGYRKRRVSLNKMSMICAETCRGTYSCAGCSLFGFLCEKRQHQLHLLFFLLADVVCVCWWKNTGTQGPVKIHHMNLVLRMGCWSALHLSYVANPQNILYFVYFF